MLFAIWVVLDYPCPSTPSIIEKNPFFKSACLLSLLRMLFSIDSILSSNPFNWELLISYLISSWKPPSLKSLISGISYLSMLSGRNSPLIESCCLFFNLFSESSLNIFVLFWNDWYLFVDVIWSNLVIYKFNYLSMIKSI